MAERVLCVIGARGGSKGVPSKNIRPLLDKPLIVWSIEQALACARIDRLVVSTDSAEIAEVATKAGAEVPFMRPPELANDCAGKFQVWQHALSACEASFSESYDVFVDLDCTNPLRDVDDITAAIQQFRSGRSRGVDAVISVCEARKNPYFTLFEADERGWFRMSKTTGKTVLRRQDQPEVYEHVASIYVLHPTYLRNANHLLDGHTEGYNIGQYKSFDLDSELDFFIIEALMRRKQSSSARVLQL